MGSIRDNCVVYFRRSVHVRWYGRCTGVSIRPQRNDDDRIDDGNTDPASLCDSPATTLQFLFIFHFFFSPFYFSYSIFFPLPVFICRVPKRARTRSSSRLSCRAVNSSRITTPGIASAFFPKLFSLVMRPRTINLGHSL